MADILIQSDTGADVLFDLTQQQDFWLGFRHPDILMSKQSLVVEDVLRVEDGGKN